MDYIHLLDNNIFRLLCSSPNGEALKNFHNSISNIPFLERGEKMAVKLSPFSILEGIGIIPPQMYKIPSNELIVLKDALSIAEYLSTKAKKYYMESEILSPDSINKKAIEQEKYVTTEARKFYNDLITEKIYEEGFFDYLYNQLTMDYIIKYDYPDELEEIILPFINMQFFMDPYISNYISNDISKFRFAKKAWNKYYNSIQHNDALHAKLVDFNKAMCLDKHADYLDCELIHFCCLGAFFNKIHLPVIAYSTDNSKYILPRIYIYKKYLDEVTTSFQEYNKGELYLPKMNKKEGFFAFCTTEGSIYKLISVSEINKHMLSD
jgi:hypothetical protein